MTNFWVFMQKRRDGEVYADLHKSNQIIYLTYEDALKVFNDDDPDFKGYYHIVKMIATLDEEEWLKTLNGLSTLPFTYWNIVCILGEIICIHTLTDLQMKKEWEIFFGIT